MIERIKDIVIVGGGTSGWMTAIALSTLLKDKYTVTLVESDDIGTIGVGEATIPLIKVFNDALNINEAEFIKETKATFKLGIEFVNWGKIGSRYVHGFGHKTGYNLYGIPFHHHWIRAKLNDKAKNLDEYSINTLAPKYSKFSFPVNDYENSPFSDITYAYHFDAGLYAKYIRNLSESRGTKRIEGKIQSVKQDENGNIRKLILEDNREICGDLFVDCSGMHSILIEKTLKSEYTSWSKWLPCDRAIAVPCESVVPITPLTRSTAHKAGWQWRIPLQHRIGNGHVFSSSFIEEDEAAEILLTRLDGKQLAQERLIKFKTGVRKEQWVKNCVSIGLSSGFLEPLESTSIYLVQHAISKLTQYFPRDELDQVDIDSFNKDMLSEYEQVRDMIILHYHINDRDDSEFWKYLKNMQLPDNLKNIIDLYKTNGRINNSIGSLFGGQSWYQILIGQGVIPKSYHPFVDLASDEENLEYLNNIHGAVKRCVNDMPTHEDVIQNIVNS